MRLIPLLCATSLLAAAVDVDIDLAALRSDAPVVRAAMPDTMRERFDATLAELQRDTGQDPRADIRRLHLTLGDSGDASVVLVGVPAALVQQRIASTHPRAKPLVLADDVLAVGLAGAPAPTAVPSAGASAITLHCTPRPEPVLPIMRHLSAIDANSDGAGHIKATLSAPSTADAIVVEERITALRDHPPLLLPPALRSIIAGIGVQRYDSVVQVAVDIPAETRQAWLRVATQRLAARMAQAD
jgi:hypothetical protein